MAYTQVNWTELVPITAANLDQMDQGIKDLADLRPVTARVLTSGTRGSASYGETLSGSDAGPSVTMDVPASGIVLVHLSARGSVDAGAAWASVALSGANNTLASSDTWAVLVGAASGEIRAGVSKLFTGLTPGSTTFTMQYRNSDGANTSTWLERELIVVGQP